MKGIGFCIIEGCGCLSPENGDDFEGVACFLADDEIILTEEEFFSLLKEACQRYTEMYPDRREELKQIISQSKSFIPPVKLLKLFSRSIETSQAYNSKQIYYSSI